MATRNPQVFHAPMNKLSIEARKNFGNYIPRIPAPGETPPARNSIWDLPTYVPPVTRQIREGSEIAFAILSKGLST